jgi:hypothetical protein
MHRATYIAERREGEGRERFAVYYRTSQWVKKITALGT